LYTIASLLVPGTDPPELLRVERKPYRPRTNDHGTDNISMEEGFGDIKSIAKGGAYSAHVED
jgi:hypothetical protein